MSKLIEQAVMCKESRERLDAFISMGVLEPIIKSWIEFAQERKDKEYYAHYIKGINYYLSDKTVEANFDWKADMSKEAVKGSFHGMIPNKPKYFSMKGNKSRQKGDELFTSDIRVYMTDDVKDLFKAQAQAENLKVSEWALKHLLNVCKNGYTEKEY